MAIRDILVTGGAGYIGSHLVDALVGRDYRVTVLDNLEPQVHRSGTWPSYANPKAEYVKGDVRDRSVFEPLVLRSQAVVHFGAAVSVGQSMYQVDRYVDVNTRGTALLLDILVNAKHHVEKVIVASSIGVYGEGAYECAIHGAVAPSSSWRRAIGSNGVPTAPRTCDRFRRPKTRCCTATTSIR
jgi:dTDP-L-rhamnose 4-epimerase